MARDTAIGVMRRIEEKYGGWIGIMRAAARDTLLYSDYQEYSAAEKALKS